MGGTAGKKRNAMIGRRAPTASRKTLMQVG